MKPRRCKGKVRHPDKLSACITAKKMKNVRIDVYKCSACNGWHLGNSNKPHRIVARIDQLLRAAKQQQQNGYTRSFTAQPDHQP